MKNIYIYAILENRVSLTFVLRKFNDRVKNLKLSKEKKAAIKQNRSTFTTVRRTKKEVGFFTTKRIIAIFALIFGVSLIFIAVKHAARDTSEHIPDTYYRLSHDFDGEIEDFSEPAADPEAENLAGKSAEELIPISCWGDSFTVASSEYSISYPGILAALSGRIVYNIGSPSDSIKTIAGRQGGIPMLTTPFIIPSDKTPVEISVDSSMGGRLTFDFSKNAGLNPCTIKGVEGMISNINGKTYFTRSSSGKEVMVYEPEPVITRAMALRRDDISIFFVGSDSLLPEPQTLVKIYRSMADYLSKGNTQYLVLSPIKGDDAAVKAAEAALAAEFGDKFLNTRLALCNDVNIKHDEYTVPSDQRETAQNGIIPKMFFDNEEYLSDFGAFALGTAIDKKLNELGYYKDADTEETIEETSAAQTAAQENTSSGAAITAK